MDVPDVGAFSLSAASMGSLLGLGGRFLAVVERLLAFLTSS